MHLALPKATAPSSGKAFNRGHKDFNNPQITQIKVCVGSGAVV
jgi:hypothetical protein